ncbi:MAG: hypothetical protein KME43_13980 [Myxacorys chilensis ATA2-1-KO14]|jgi:hypothetical protein|nr:hypothetical protein [Myxacorys chilensis ATA2-1-KO14]
MNLAVLSQKAFILQSLVTYIQAGGVQGGHQSFLLEDGLTELVRILMRELAADVSYRSRLSLLDQAIEDVQQQMWEYVFSSAISNINFDDYFARIRHRLKASAREMADLQINLRVAKRREQIVEREEITEAVEVPFQIAVIGLRETLEGLIATPLADQPCFLNLSDVRHRYTVQEEHYPLQIEIDELVFVVDDDGTIFISTENFPGTLIRQAREALETLARQIYGSTNLY